MDFGVSDIVKGIELGLTIYRFGFVEENAAGEVNESVRYATVD